MFPDIVHNKEVKKILETVKTDSEVRNPLFGADNFFTSLVPKHPTTEPEQHILKAIQSKANKPHIGKNDTILIIDNRFMLAGLDFMVERLKYWRFSVEASPFEEIWLYTGYGSYYFGADGEYALFPLKLGCDLHPKYLRAEHNVMPWKTPGFSKRFSERLGDFLSRFLWPGRDP